MYRNLTTDEIHKLESQYCKSENWDKVTVCSSGVDLARIQWVEFEGEIKLGNSTLKKVRLSNCTIGNNSNVCNITDGIYNCNIGDNVQIQNCQTIFNTIGSTFGNGVKIDTLNEYNGRSINLFEGLNAQIAELVVKYRNAEKFQYKIKNAIDRFVSNFASKRGIIGNNSVIKNCNQLQNFNCAEECKLSGAHLIHNVSVGKNSTIGVGVILRDCIVASDSEVVDAAILNKCFVGEGCLIGEGFCANDSMFFANSALLRGEAAALFAGPYTVSHHKSTLLIALQTSFFNAGSGANQSNHRYRLGAIHQGITERGTKLGSSSYMLLPVKVGSFSTVVGQHHKSVDFSALPFSLIIGYESAKIVPAINLRNSGLGRDIIKWKNRDKRISAKSDRIDFNFDDNPFLISEILAGYTTLNNLYDSNPEQDVFNYFGYEIDKRSLLRGIELYRRALERFIALCTEPNCEPVQIEWVDLAGMVVAKYKLNELLESDFTTIDELNVLIDGLNENAEQDKSKYARYIDLTIHGKFSTLEEVKHLGLSAIDYFEQQMELDAQKEFSEETQIGYIDDFEEVRSAQKVSEIITQIKSHNNELRDKIEERTE